MTSDRYDAYCGEKLDEHGWCPECKQRRVSFTVHPELAASLRRLHKTLKERSARRKLVEVKQAYGVIVPDKRQGQLSLGEA